MSPQFFPALIFAAGFGTRMKQLTQTQPKPLIPVAGKPLIDHALALAKQAGCTPIVANLHYKADQLEAHLKPQGVITVVEQPDILETGGGLRNALPALGSDTVITLNSDAIWAGPNPVGMLINAWRPEVMDALLITLPIKGAIGHQGDGDFTIAQDGKLARGPGQVYGGIQILKTALLHEINEEKFSLNLIWDQMLKAKTLFGLSYTGKWCDVGHPDGITMAKDMLARAHV